MRRCANEFDTYSCQSISSEAAELAAGYKANLEEKQQLARDLGAIAQERVRDAKETQQGIEELIPELQAKYSAGGLNMEGRCIEGRPQIRTAFHVRAPLLERGLCWGALK